MTVIGDAGPDTMQIDFNDSHYRVESDPTLLIDNLEGYLLYEDNPDNDRKIQEFLSKYLPVIYSQVKARLFPNQG